MFYTLNSYKMKKLLEYLPSFRTIRLFFDLIYYFGFLGWFMMKSILIASVNYVVTTNDIFLALMFVGFTLLDVNNKMTETKD